MPLLSGQRDRSADHRSTTARRPLGGPLGMSGQFSSIGLSVWQASRNAALTAADYMTPVLAESHFIEKGVLTPEEFVLAGDMLALRCPTWKWQGGDPAKSRAILPKDKQFLITRNVPCQQRAIVLGRGACDERNIDFGDGQEWVETHISRAHRSDGDAPDLVNLAVAVAPACSAAASKACREVEANIEEAGLEDCQVIEVEDPGELSDGASGQRGDNIRRTRTYDVSISYDKYYQCARIWLRGYSEARQPLTQEQVLEDISAEHALKTVTMEAHPHISTAGFHASIHPCKHASVMHKLCAEMSSAGRSCRPEQYLFLFLKFISSVVPTIEYDYTLSVDGMC